MSGPNKVFFLHIPKTAGSSFNGIFKPAFPEDRYFEHMEGRRPLIGKVVQDGGPFFMSGHLLYDPMRPILVRPDVFSLTILRDPVHQFVSHLKWAKYVGSPAFPARNNIPEGIMDVARNLYKVPLGSVRDVEKAIDTAVGRRLFDNLHVRYMTNGRVDQVELPQTERAIENIKTLSFFFVLDDIVPALNKLRSCFPAIGDMQVLNTARVEDEMDIADSEVRRLLLKYTKHDRDLYDFARSYSSEHHLRAA